MKRAGVLLLGAMLLVPGIAGAAPNDERYPSQWGLHVIGASAAWTVSEGQGAIVAVVDTGVDPGHRDLQGRLLPGRDFVDDDDDPADENGHGTMVAGIVAARTNNGVDVASVAPRARILPVRVLDGDGTGTSQNVAQGIRWAVGEGADVINLSLAQDGPGGGGLLGGELLRDPSVADAIRDAARDGAVVVVAAGNDRDGGTTETAYDAPAGIAALVVGASTRDDRRAAYSNYGPGLDLLAPGGGSAIDPSPKGCTGNNSIVSTWWDPEDGGSKVAGGCGTSMSVAFVSGVAAQLRAMGRTNQQTVNRILATARDLGEPGRDDQTGHGRLDAARALGASVSSPTPSPTAAATQRPPPPVAPPVRAQAEQDPVVSPPRQAGSPSVSPSPSPLPPPAVPSPSAPPIAFPAPPTIPTKGWPVPVAAALVSTMVLAHAWRFLREAPRS